MYLQEITLRNIKCFEDLTIDFSQALHHPSDAAAVRHWTTLFGMNGLGKSTLLQAMGIVLAGPSAAKDLLSVADGWVRKGCGYDEIEAKLLWTEGDTPMKRPRKSTPFAIRYLIAGDDVSKLPPALVEKPNPGDITAWSGAGDPKEKEAYTKDRLMLQETAYQEQVSGWLSCGYGPFRRLSGGSEFANNIVSKGRRSARFVTLFHEAAALTNAAEWLMSLHNESRDGYKDSARALELVRSAIKVISDDRAFDAFMLRTFNNGLKVIIDPLFEKQRGLVGGTIVLHQEALMHDAPRSKQGTKSKSKGRKTKSE